MSKENERTLVVVSESEDSPTEVSLLSDLLATRMYDDLRVSTNRIDELVLVIRGGRPHEGHIEGHFQGRWMIPGEELRQRGVGDGSDVPAYLVLEADKAAPTLVFHLNSTGVLTASRLRPNAWLVFSSLSQFGGAYGANGGAVEFHNHL